jgi:membrane dipeptidase
VRDAAALGRCLDGDRLACVLHLEGADGIDDDLSLLSVLHAAGLRSLGLVWSRPNAFAEGVPLRHPSSPDTGPGLTRRGRELVRACNDLGILVDLAHLNERGFWHVAHLSRAPLVASHTAAHALSPAARNLTDEQIDAIGATGGLVGITFHVGDLRADGRQEANTGLDELARHLEHVAERIGIDHVGLGSDFDGALIPKEIGDAAGLPRLLDHLRARGWDDEALRKLSHANWARTLATAWSAP